MITEERSDWNDSCGNILSEFDARMRTTGPWAVRWPRTNGGGEGGTRREIVDRMIGDWLTSCGRHVGGLVESIRGAVAS